MVVRDIVVGVRLHVQIFATDRAETSAVGVVEDLIRQRECDRVAGPGCELELILEDVLALELIVPAGGRGVVLTRIDPDLERRVFEAAHARAVQPNPETQLEE